VADSLHTMLRRNCSISDKVNFSLNAVGEFLFVAELAMHSERVSRHINGVEQSLVELRQALRSMIDNSRQRVERFRADVDKFEKQFVAATKTSRYNIMP